ncbi:hypothetical protein EVAR_62077_1 [Eumeta japonica]|uniref:Uncharacterized protein n=1 Tax=Eumeta variegata TaxID=151549 RepID=A0A4C1Z230_EUMVA|nr:hypothetical protein EVAR_62077_1 [Eumeta japonica]
MKIYIDVRQQRSARAPPAALLRPLCSEIDTQAVTAYGMTHAVMPPSTSPLSTPLCVRILRRFTIVRTLRTPSPTREELQLAANGRKSNRIPKLDSRGRRVRYYCVIDIGSSISGLYSVNVDAQTNTVTR